MSNATVSVSLDRLPWTTRDGVAATLIAIAHGPSIDAATRAIRLLREVVTPDLLPQILGVGLRRDRPATVRTWALGIVAAHEGYAVPDEALGALLDEQPLVPPADCGWPDVPSAAAVLALVKTPAHRRLMCAYLDRAARAVSVALLDESGADEEVVRHARARWLAGVDLADPSDEDAEIAGNLREQDGASLRVVAAHWRAHGMGDGTRSLGHRALAGLLAPEEREARARRLDLDLPNLIETLGARGLRRALRAAVLDHSFALRCPLVDRRETEPRYRKACSILGWWSEGPAIAAGILARAVLHATVEGDLAELLVHAHRASARRWLAARMRDPELLPQVRAVLRSLAWQATPEDGPILRAALAVPDVEVRCQALEGLDVSGDDDPGLRDVLRALASQPEPLSRLCAARALARRGEARFFETLVAARVDPDGYLRALVVSALGDLAGHPVYGRASIAALAASATEDPSPRVRTEALRGLARSPAAADHVDLFERALLSDPEREEGYDTLEPVRDNAARALGVAGGPRALQMLLAAAFVVPESAFCAVALGLSVLMVCPDGPPSARDGLLRSWGEWFRRGHHRPSPEAPRMDSENDP